MIKTHFTEEEIKAHRTKITYPGFLSSRGSVEGPGAGVRGRRHTRVVPYDYSYRQTQHSV